MSSPSRLSESIPPLADPRKTNYAHGDAYVAHADLFSPVSFLNPNDHATSRIIQKAIALPKKSFASVVAASTSVPLPTPAVSKQGAFQAIKVNNEIYQKRLQLCQHSLIGRIVLNKGETPWTLPKLKEHLSSIWTLNEDWRLISLGHGYCQILLHSVVAKNVVWNRGSISLKPGIMRIQQWSPGFDPYKEKSTSTQLWIHFYRLP